MHVPNSMSTTITAATYPPPARPATPAILASPATPAAQADLVTQETHLIDHKNVGNMMELMQELKRCNEQQKIVFLKAGAAWCSP